jgi:hypothetical protein
MTVLPPILIAMLSAIVVALLLAHRRANLGGAAALAFALSATLYAWVRSRSIAALAEAHLGSSPYRLGRSIVTVGGVPLQELFGWVSAIGLASYFADRLLRRFTGSASAWATSLASAVGMATICLAVETAAVSAGWWSWNLGHSSLGGLRFPAIALLDWSFVALDLLLPFELWRRRAPAFELAAGLCCFPVHLLGHTWTGPVSRLLPLSGFDIVHVGLVAAVAAMAWRTRDGGPWPASDFERWHAAPLAAAAILLGTTSAQLFLLGEGSLLWTGLPLAAVAAGAFIVRVQAPSIAGSEGSVRGAAAIFGLLLLGGSSLLLPAAIRARDFTLALRSGAAALAAGDLERARPELQSAVRLRPSNADAAWLLGWAELRSGRRAEARTHLEIAVARRLASVEAVRYLALLDLQEGRAQDALTLLERRKRRHAETADLAYLAWMAKRGSVAGEAAPRELLETADEGGLREVVALAIALGDRPTLEVCRELDRNRAGPSGEGAR